MLTWAQGNARFTVFNLYAQNSKKKRKSKFATAYTNEHKITTIEGKIKKEEGD